MGVVHRGDNHQARKKHFIVQGRYAEQVNPNHPSCSRNVHTSEGCNRRRQTILLSRRTWKIERQVTTCVKGVDQIDSLLIDGDNAFNNLRMAEL